jgi:hypothetical protein
MYTLKHKSKTANARIVDENIPPRRLQVCNNITNSRRVVCDHRVHNLNDNRGGGGRQLPLKEVLGNLAAVLLGDDLRGGRETKQKQGLRYRKQEDRGDATAILC